jgi:hypothetical protein
MLLKWEMRTSVTLPSSFHDTAEICPHFMNPLSDQMPSS